jgi:PAS domain S-box-containing protein
MASPTDGRPRLRSIAAALAVTGALTAVAAPAATAAPLTLRVVNTRGVEQASLVSPSLAACGGLCGLTVTDARGQITLDALPGDSVTATRGGLAPEGTGVGYWEAIVGKDAIFVSDRWSQMVGLERDPTVPMSVDEWREMVHPDDRAKVEQVIDACFNNSDYVFQLDYRLRHADGHWIWVLSRGTVIERAMNGAALRVVGTQLDITPRKVAEFALAESVDAALHATGASHASAELQQRVLAMAYALPQGPARRTAGGWLRGWTGDWRGWTAGLATATAAMLLGFVLGVSGTVPFQTGTEQMASLDLDEGSEMAAVMLGDRTGDLEQ